MIVRLNVGDHRHGGDRHLQPQWHALLSGHCLGFHYSTSRQSTRYHLIKGQFQRRLEQFLTPDMRVQRVSAGAGPSPGGGITETAH